MRISDWSSDVCSSDLDGLDLFAIELAGVRRHGAGDVAGRDLGVRVDDRFDQEGIVCHRGAAIGQGDVRSVQAAPAGPDQSRVVERVAGGAGRSEEHTSELQSLMRISYAVFCLNKKIY